MTAWHPYCDEIDLFVKGRIPEEDADRQRHTACIILSRLVHQPGLILADEVGMGKTFVALTVAVSVAVATRSRDPIVVMVPPSLKEKWPQDFSVFREKCCRGTAAKSVRAETANSAVDLLRLLKAPAGRRCSIVFLTHGAMHRALSDGWVKLAIVQRALRGRHHTRRLRAALSRCAGPLLRLGWAGKDPEIWNRLLDRSSEEWAAVLKRHEIEVAQPVPTLVAEALARLDASDVADVYEELQRIPRRQSPTYGARLAEARRALSDAMKLVWKNCVTELSLDLPLLIMDEAHHLKNPKTKLSGLFQVPEARDDADEVSKGVFEGVFERMLFLTATPFQLGHSELCSVLDRFMGIRWEDQPSRLQSRESFVRKLEELSTALDTAQLAARNLDHAWGLLRPEDLQLNGIAFDDPETWWKAIREGSELTDRAQHVRNIWCETRDKIGSAAEKLGTWVIRHLKPDRFRGKLRRQRLPGDAITTDAATTDRGIPISGEQLLPFLLAARATFCSPGSRPVFAEGLASSYAAFLETRQASNARSPTSPTDDDDPVELDGAAARAASWYLDQLEASLPKGHGSSVLHPKVHATAMRVMEEWRRGEKVLVFCHYRRTGHALQEIISGWMRDEIRTLGAKKLGCKPDQVEKRLELIGKRFFDSDSPARRACNREAAALLDAHPSLAAYRERLLAVSRKFIRTPSFLVRYLPAFKGDRIDESTIRTAFSEPDGSGLSLKQVLNGFFDFLEIQCGEEERRVYLDAIERVQTGRIIGGEARKSFADEELYGKAGSVLANVRLANGTTSSETRRRLMLTFNSPFFPEVLITSNVLAEGVDLHRFCRYVIHHDLC